MLKKLNNLKESFKTISRYISIEKFLKIFQHSNEYLNLLNMNYKSSKFYAISKLVGDIDQENLHDAKYFCYSTYFDYNEENQKCLNEIRNKLFKDHYAKKMYLFLENEEDEENGDNSVDAFRTWGIYKKFNIYKLALYIDSNLTLTKQKENFLFQTVKPEKTFLYLIIKQENKIINKFLNTWKGHVYSLIFSKDLEDQNLFKKILSVQDINLLTELIVNL